MAEPVESENKQSPAQTTKQEPVAFQPGIRIDWVNSTVLLDGKIVLRDGPLEFLACFAGKEHESIVRLSADATHVYLALGLIGLEPSTENKQAALCDIRVRWQIDGQMRESGDHEWLLSRRLAQTAVPRAARFTGSVQRPDGTVVAAGTGAGFAIVSMPDALIEPTSPLSSRDAELWARVNTSVIPPNGTAVTVLVRPAQPNVLPMRLDERGLVWVGERIVNVDTLLDLLRQAQLLAPNSPVHITDAGALAADQRRLRQFLAARDDIPPVEFVRAAPTPPVPDTSESAR